MKRQHMMWYALVLIVGVVVAIAVGANVSTVLLAMVLLACPVMMIFMMSGGHRHGPDHDVGDTHYPRGTTGQS